ncbi:unnamed protein product, partial [Discosporangium mesarthrocarpum]
RLERCSSGVLFCSFFCNELFFLFFCFCMSEVFSFFSRYAQNRCLQSGQGMCMPRGEWGLTNTHMVLVAWFVHGFAQGNCGCLWGVGCQLSVVNFACRGIIVGVW